LTYLVAPQGLAAVYRAFPQIRILAAAKGYDTEEWTFALPGHAIAAEEEQPAAEDTDGNVNHLEETFKRLQFHRRTSDAPTDQKKKAWIVVPGKFYRSV
jgi:alkanesulfonate monooxygenase SsuD/methylene tetrahydromethanopterin reductase-like flavin-dependent oxidoreductase (luciferase family)